MKKIIIACIALLTYAMHASEATARTLINAGNYNAAFAEIDHMPQAQWQQKKKLLFTLIDAWNPALQPALIDDIRQTAQNNMAQGHAQEVYQRALKKLKATPPAPVRPKAPKAPRVPVLLPPPVPVQPVPPAPDVIDEALKDPTIPADVQKQLNNLAPNQREQVEQALNRSKNANQWQKAGAALIGGIGALGLRWLWDWYHGHAEGAAPRASGEPKEEEKQPMQQKEKKEKEEKEKEQKVQEAKKPAPKSDYELVFERHGRRIMEGFPNVIEQYRAGVNAQPQTFESLTQANIQLIHLERTLSLKAAQDMLATLPNIEKLLTEYDLYPLNELRDKEQELLDGYMVLARREFTRIEKQQEAFAKELAHKEPITKNLLDGLTKTATELTNALNQLRQIDARFQTPEGIYAANRAQRTAFAAQLEMLGKELKNNDNEISRLSKGVGQ